MCLKRVTWVQTALPYIPLPDCLFQSSLLLVQVSAYIAICMKRVVSAKGGKPNPEWCGVVVQLIVVICTSRMRDTIRSEGEGRARSLQRK